MSATCLIACGRLLRVACTGASGCWAYFTVHVLYQLGRVADARWIFMPMLEAYARGTFQGTSSTGMMNGWRDWKGGGHGYEGMLVDNYFPLLAVEDDLASRQQGESMSTDRP